MMRIFSFPDSGGTETREISECFPLSDKMAEVSVEVFSAGDYHKQKPAGESHYGRDRRETGEQNGKDTGESLRFFRKDFFYFPPRYEETVYESYRSDSGGRTDGSAVTLCLVQY